MLSHVRLFVTPWAKVHQAPLSIGFFQPEYWSGLPFSPPGDLPDPGIEPASPVCPTVAGRLFSTEPLGKPREMERAPFHFSEQRVSIASFYGFQGYRLEYYL